MRDVRDVREAREASDVSGGERCEGRRAMRG